jgi:acyl-CoA synthetase (AMP-forming)/AMP-acid ligase II
MEHEKVYRTDLTPVSFLRRSAFIYPEKTAVVHGDRRYTYRDFEERVNRLASRLRADGLEKHDRVAFLCPNIPAMLEAHFAVTRSRWHSRCDQHSAERRRGWVHPRALRRPVAVCG